MIILIIFCFLISLIAIFWSYLGYAIHLLVLSKRKKNNTFENNLEFKEVTLLITAFNEEKRINEKIKNTLKLNYPKDKLKIYVASDGSTDQTNDIIRSYKMEGIQLIEIKQRKGKENAQKEAIRQTKGDIIVFSDVATKLDKNGLAEIVSNFNDPSVGCVSSTDKFINKDGKESGEGAYVKYEMWLRRLESQVYSLVGLSGSFFAARRKVCENLSTEYPSDFGVLLNSIKMGYRGISDPKAIGYYEDLSDQSKEFSRKVRTVLRGITAFTKNIDLLNIFNYGFFSYQLFCHKLLRWLVPFFLILIFVSNIFLFENSNLFKIIFIVQTLFYLLALFGYLSPKFESNILIKIPKYFVAVNSSIFIAWLKFFKGERIVMWQPSKR